jgi:hypothetical protein
MTITQDQLDSFHVFASEKVNNGGLELTWPELFDLWRIENPTADQQAEIYAALDESLADIEAGRTQPVAEAWMTFEQSITFPNETPS